MAKYENTIHFKELKQATTVQNGHHYTQHNDVKHDDVSMTTFREMILITTIKNATFSRTIRSIMKGIVMLSVSYAECCVQALDAECHYAGFPSC
jgi:hypothetical protein